LNIKISLYQKGVGCNHCDGTGYKGRVGVYEFLEIDSHIKSMISQREAESEVYKYLKDKGMKIST
jgi:type II secretory ATPase GspE/PulE/Tfp pilus assembly ATPase PilB-like protein